MTQGGTEPFPFWAQVRRAVGPGVSLQLIAAQPGQGLEKRLSRASFLMRYLPLCCLREREGCGEVKHPPGSSVQGWGSALCQLSERKGGAGAQRLAGAGWCLGVRIFTGCLGSDWSWSPNRVLQQGTATRWDLSPETSKARGVGVLFRHSSQGTPVIKKEICNLSH